MRICVITCYGEVVVGPGAHLCTLFRGVGSGSRDVDVWRANVSVRRGSGSPDADGPGVCLSQTLGVDVDSLVFIHLIPRIDHKIRMVINRLNHHYPNTSWSMSGFTDRVVIQCLDTWVTDFKSQGCWDREQSCVHRQKSTNGETLQLSIFKYLFHIFVHVDIHMYLHVERRLIWQWQYHFRHPNGLWIFS